MFVCTLFAAMGPVRDFAPYQAILQQHCMPVPSHTATTTEGADHSPTASPPHHLVSPPLTPATVKGTAMCC